MTVGIIPDSPTNHNITVTVGLVILAGARNDLWGLVRPDQRKEKRMAEYRPPTKDRFSVTTAGWRKTITKVTPMKSYLATAKIRNNWGTKSVVLTLYRDGEPSQALQTTNELSFTPEIITELYKELVGLK